SQIARSLREMTLGELLRQERELGRSATAEDRMTRNMARVEIHKKFAIPFACIAFGVLGLPLGITNRRGGKSSGFSLSVAIILFYYVALNNGEQLAVTGKIPPWLGMWGANIILLLLGMYLLSRANRDISSSRDRGIVRRMVGAIASKLRPRKPSSSATVDEGPGLLSRLDITFPNILDRYILREFIKILALVLISVIALFVIVDYNAIASYDRNKRELSQVQVFELHPTDFRMTRRVYARVARWNGSAWAFEDGWMRSFTDDGRSTFTPITTPLALFYPETPEDFASDVKPPDQMTYAQLRRYIHAIGNSGYAAEELTVKLYAKTSWPVISIVMALIALPFAFRM